MLTLPNVLSPLKKYSIKKNLYQKQDMQNSYNYIECLLLRLSTPT